MDDPLCLAAKQPLDVLLLYNATASIVRGDATDALPDANDEEIAAFSRALESLGHNVRALGVTYADLDRLERLEDAFDPSSDRPRFVFNLCEGTGLDGHPGLEVVAALEASGIPYSGAGPLDYWLTTGKWRMKTRLAAARVPVPLGVVVPGDDVSIPSELRFPLFVKPRDGFGSLGVHEGSVVHDRDAARRAVAAIAHEFGGYALVEEFVAGRELTVGIIGSSREALVLPPLEVRFGAAYDDKPHIRMFATKFDDQSALYYDFETVCPAPLEPDVEARVKQVALAAYRALSCEGYARVDIRLATDGRPFVLEVNSNCSLEHHEHASDCGMLPLIARAMGWSFPELLQRLIGAGLRRRRAEGRPPLAARWHLGRIASHALIDREPGERFMPFGAVYPAGSKVSPEGLFVTTTGRRVYVEPDIRSLGASAEPNLRAVQEDGVLWLVAARPIRAGDVLTIDPSRPLELGTTVRRPRARGRPLHAPARREARGRTAALSV